VTPVFGTVFFPQIRSYFFHRRSTKILFLESVNYSTYDTDEALAVDFNILFVEFSRPFSVDFEITLLQSLEHMCSSKLLTFKAICLQHVIMYNEEKLRLPCLLSDL